MTSWLRVPAVLMTVPAVVAVAADVAHAQIEHELELGGGFHVALPFHDVVALPRRPSVHARVVRWLSPRWGIGGRFMAVLGSRRRWGIERDRLTHLYLTGRYRRPLERNHELHVGVGGGLVSWRVRGHRTDGRQSVYVGSVWVDLEVLISRQITEQVSVRAGIAGAALPLVYVHPVVLAAYRF